MLSFTRSIVSLSALVLVACSSSNFDVASSGNDAGGDTSSIEDSIGLDTTPGADSTTGDGPGIDVPGPDTPTFDGTSDVGKADAPGCSGALCPFPGGSAVCVDLETDPKNCGACGKAVCHGELCTSGVPKCVPGFGACPAAAGCLGCKDFASDPTNCGDCGKLCVVGEYCIDGACKSTTSCPSGTTRCGGPDVGPAGCADTKNDRNNCGGCGAACAPDEYCANGSCVQYTSAPGCTACPCGVCSGKFDTCCSYGGNTVCATGDCPAG